MPSLATASSSSGNFGGLLILLLPLLLIGLMFWSQRRRSRQFEQAQAALSIGDEVSTTSGLLGTLVSLDDQVGSLQVAPGVVLQFDRRAIVPSTVTPSAGATPASDSDNSAAADRDGTDSTGSGPRPGQGS